MGSSSDFVKVGDVWIIVYQETPVRMKVSRVEADGQILLVEVDPPTERPWIRTILSNYKQLVEVGMPDFEFHEDDEPTLPDAERPRRPEDT